MPLSRVPNQNQTTSARTSRQSRSRFLRDPAHLEASFDWFRTFPQDIKDDAVEQKTKLTMPVLAIGADHSLGAAEDTQVRQYATHVTGMVIKNSGHWITKSTRPR